MTTRCRSAHDPDDQPVLGQLLRRWPSHAVRHVQRLCLYVDLDVTAPIDLTGFGAWLYDQGVGNPINPDQTGLTANVNIYTTPGSYLGNEQEMSLIPPIMPGTAGSVWTLAGTGACVVEGLGRHRSQRFGRHPRRADQPARRAVRRLPRVQPPGSVGPCQRRPDQRRQRRRAAPADPLARDAAHAAGLVHNDLLAGLPERRVLQRLGQRGQHQPAHRLRGNAGVGYFAEFGDGCYFPSARLLRDPDAADGIRPVEHVLDVPAGHCRQLRRVPGCRHAAVDRDPPGSHRAAADAQRGLDRWHLGRCPRRSDHAALHLDAPGGVAATEITIGSNGHVFLGAVTDPNAAFGFYGAIADFQDFPARFAPAWGDLDPASPTNTGSIFFDASVAGQFTITWENIEEWNVAGPTNTMQITVTDFGPGAIDQVDVVYGNMNMTAAEMLTGWTPGNGADLPAQIDFSAITATGFQGGDGSIPPILTMDARPVIGTTPNLVTTNITPGTFFVFSFLDFGAAPFPIPLAFAQMPGCFQHISGVGASGSLVGVNPSLEAPRPFSIPNLPTLAGVKLFSQSAPFTAGLNPAGILSSNGLCLRVGL